MENPFSKPVEENDDVDVQDGSNVAETEELEEVDRTDGCEACHNTGLENGNVIQDAKTCPVCNGSPFGESSVTNEL